MSGFFKRYQTVTRKFSSSVVIEEKNLKEQSKLAI